MSIVAARDPTEHHLEFKVIFQGVLHYFSRNWAWLMLAAPRVPTTPAQDECDEKEFQQWVNRLIL